MICALEALLIMMSTTTVELFLTYLWSSTISRNVTAVHSPLYLLQGRSQRPKDLLKTSCAQNFTTTRHLEMTYILSSTTSPTFHLFLLVTNEEVIDILFIRYSMNSYSRCKVYYQSRVFILRFIIQIWVYHSRLWRSRRISTSHEICKLIAAIN